MTTLATARWQRLDGPGQDSCRLIAEPAGWMLCGHARFAHNSSEAALDYVVRCDGAWQTTSADVSGLLDAAEVGWKIARTGNGWSLNGTAAGLADCVDIDLGFTPATNLLPVRRFRLLEGGSAELSAAWFLPGDGGGLTRLNQSYHSEAGRVVTYRSDQFEARLDLHDSGFATRYGDLWEGQVDVAG